MSTTTNGVPVPTTPTAPPQVTPQSNRWDLQSLMRDMESEMERLFGHRPTLLSWSQGLRPRGDWTPSVDVFEADGKLVVKAELPGVEKDDIEVAMQQGDLVIKGQRTNDHEAKEDSYYRMERFYGSFYRRIPLPPGVQPTDLSAGFKDGVLTISMTTPQETVNATKIAIS